MTVPQNLIDRLRSRRRTRLPLLSGDAASLSGGRDAVLLRLCVSWRICFVLRTSLACSGRPGPGSTTQRRMGACRRCVSAVWPEPCVSCAPIWSAGEFHARARGGRRARRARMSRLSNLLRQVEQNDPQLAADSAPEVKALRLRRQFGRLRAPHPGDRRALRSPNPQGRQGPRPRAPR